MLQLVPIPSVKVTISRGRWSLYFNPASIMTFGVPDAIHNAGLPPLLPHPDTIETMVRTRVEATRKK